MQKKARAFLAPEEEKLLGLLLDQADPAIKESGLERLCKWYRSGYRLRDPHPFRQRLNGLTHYPSSKVVRWSLNTIALVGTPLENLEATFIAIEKYRNNPDILAAGVAALVVLTPPDKVIDALKKAQIPFEGAPLLAAAQHTNAFLSQLAQQRVKPDRAEVSELRMAAVLVGLNKAPENLFEPNYNNSEIVGILNNHHDALVAQYSVWAICENAGLSVANLKIPLQEIESHPENVRGWVYQLLGSADSSAKRYREYLKVGSEDPSEKARLGLASGLRGTFFDGLEEITIDWFSAEQREPIKFAILDHMATNGEKCPAYQDAVKEAYKNAGMNSLARARLEAASQGTPLYAALKRISIHGETLSLFGAMPDDSTGGTTIVTQNIRAKNVAIGNMSGRDSNIQGNVNANQSVVEQARDSLDVLQKLLENNHEHGIESGLALVRDAHESPNKGTIGRVLEWMKSASDTAKYAVVLSTAFGQVYEALTHISSLFS